MIHYPCRPSFVDDVTIDPFELNHNSLVSFTYCTMSCKHNNIFNLPSLYLVSFVDIKINVDLSIVIYLPLFINNLQFCPQLENISNQQLKKGWLKIREHKHKVSECGKVSRKHCELQKNILSVSLVGIWQPRL